MFRCQHEVGNYLMCHPVLQVRQYGETYLPDQYVMHDPSRVVVAGDYGLMVAVTGKEQGGNSIDKSK